MASHIPIFRSELQARLLALILLNPERSWTTPELVDRLQTTSVTVHRELHRALNDGLLTREPIGRTFLYRAATDSPLYEPLVSLLERTVGLESELRETLATTPGVEAAFIHGSFAQGAGTNPLSDVDVLVIGSPDPHALRRRIREVERRAGREIDLTAYESGEFAALVEGGNSFARRVAHGPVKPLVGTLADLPGRS